MPAQTGLSQLGDALLKGSGDYANMKIRKQREDEARAQAIADLADQRRYSEGQNQQARTNRFEDQTKVAQFNSRFESLQRAEKLGLIAATDIGKIEIENMALVALAKREAADEAKRAEFKAKAKTRLDKLQKTQGDIVKRIQKNEEIADTPIEPQGNELRVIQERLARAAYPQEKNISEVQIETQLGAAQAEWGTKVYDKRQALAQKAKIDAANDRMLLREIAQERNMLMQLAPGEIGDVPETVLSNPDASGVNPPATRPDPADKFIPAPTPAPVSALADPAGEYGGARGLFGSLRKQASDAMELSKIRNARDTGVSQFFDNVIGGDRQLAEGDAARAAKLQELVNAFNVKNPSAPQSIDGPKSLLDPFFRGRAAHPIASFSTPTDAPAPLTYEQFLQFQEQLKNGVKPLPKLNQLRIPPRTSVFSSPDPYSSMGN